MHASTIHASYWVKRGVTSGLLFKAPKQESMPCILCIVNIYSKWMAFWDTRWQEDGQLCYSFCFASNCSEIPTQKNTHTKNTHTKNTHTKNTHHLRATTVINLTAGCRKGFTFCFVLSNCPNVQMFKCQIVQQLLSLWQLTTTYRLMNCHLFFGIASCFFGFATCVPKLQSLSMAVIEEGDT